MRRIYLTVLVGLAAAGLKVNAASQSNVSTSSGTTNRYTKAMSVHDAKTMRDAQKKRSGILSKRHNMRNKQSRAEVVHQLKAAEEERMGAVRRRASAEGLELVGQWSDGRGFRLVDFDEKGFPVYDVDQNINAAISTAADQVRDSTTFQPPVPEGFVQVEAEVAYPDNQSGILTQTCSDIGGGEQIAYIVNGDWAEYTIDIPEAGEYILKFRTSSKSASGGSINLSANGSSIGSVVVPDTDNWNTWTTVRTHVVFATAGTQTLRTTFSGGSGSLFNINWFSYAPDYDTVTIGLWEAGSTPRVTHREIVGKVSIMDGTSTPSDHATHVAGTLVSRGIDSRTLGMAPEASIAAFNSSYAETEMTAHGAAEPGTTNLYLSNHSYGAAAGWLYYYGAWHYHGTFVDDGDLTSDYVGDFGRYSSRSEEWDGIAYNLPYYQIFAASGNAREDTVPDEGDAWKYGSGTAEVEYVYDSSQHPPSNRSYKGGWDNMATGALAKNAITVGNGNDAVTGGVRDVDAASAYSTSSRGPADDGRIKPDITGNGVGVISCGSASDTDLASKSGSSMASPNVCGSAALLIDYYTSRFPGGAMRASTLKALLLHTADDRWNAGPDYKYGWGVMNTKTAADVIKTHADNQGGGALLESVVDATTTSCTRTFSWDGTSPLRVTLCWTDPPAAEIVGHDNRTKALVNDLNLKVIGPDETHYPYVMPYVVDGDWDEDKIDQNATTGINDVDNVEQVYLATPAAGVYEITVDYAGSLTNGEQDYSLIVTGQDGLEFTEVEVWRTEYFGTTNATGDMADDADYDDDGYANLLEFGLATVPTSSNADPVVFEIDPTYAKLIYPRNLNSTNEYDFEMIWSDNLLSNNWTTMSVVENILSESGSVQQVEASLPVGNSSNRYFRLRISEK